jgi:hypothetical protein
MRIFLFLILFSFSLISSGCHTYYPSRESPDSLKFESDEYIKIMKFYLYNGDTIDVKDFDVKYYEKYKNYESVFVCIHLPGIEENQVFYKETKKEDKIILSKEVKSVTTEKRRTNILRTVIVTISSITALILLAYLFLVMNGGLLGNGKIG